MKNFLHVWLLPLVFAIISSIGLISALTGDDAWDMVSWLMLIIPLAAIVYYVFKSRERLKKA
ncbi:hypothetical protein DJ568_09655 [Mucilaginibacter hurinus]|uniref:Uncharacterized protein n=1 Tax=Mucilaginibacter hurinus TaxID=2201324 RepID=A0A367GNY0_9SPHI|nr:hypothetical protein [Mucilaginibacter hurinus]RCH54745.1 hypothetical protein DJ568_09655 [Mucilaginibacter hurinus]